MSTDAPRRGERYSASGAASSAASAASAASRSLGGGGLVLGRLDGDEPVTVAITRSRSPGKREALGGRRCRSSLSESPTPRSVTSTSTWSIEGRRQAEDGDLVGRLLEHAAVELDAARLADQVDRRACLDRLVEPDREQVDVRDAIADRVELELLEDRGDRGLLARDLHVEHRVASRLAGQRLPQHRRRHGEGRTAGGLPRRGRRESCRCGAGRARRTKRPGSRASTSRGTRSMVLFL